MKLVGKRKSGRESIDLFYVMGECSWHIEGDFLVITYPTGIRYARRIPSSVEEIQEDRVTGSDPKMTNGHPITPV